jgi:hypothetical protein
LSREPRMVSGKGGPGFTIRYSPFAIRYSPFTIAAS